MLLPHSLQGICLFKSDQCIYPNRGHWWMLTKSNQHRSSVGSHGLWGAGSCPLQSGGELTQVEDLLRTGTHNSSLLRMISTGGPTIGRTSIGSPAFVEGVQFLGLLSMLLISMLYKYLPLRRIRLLNFWVGTFSMKAMLSLPFLLVFWRYSIK